MAVVGLCVTSGAGVAAPPPIPKIPKIPGIPKVPAGYNFKARVDVKLRIDWVAKVNPAKTPCAQWSVTDGVWRTTLHAYIPGHFSPTAAAKTGGWANFQGVGKVYDPSKTERSTSQRSIAWSGGIVWPSTCSGTKPRVVQPPDDCDDPGQPRGVSGQADFRASRRSDMTLLEDIVNESSGKRETVSVDVAPGRGWYRKCSISPGGFDNPVDLTFELDADDIKRLKQLQVDKSWSYSKSYRGFCVDNDQIADSDSCTFSLGVAVGLRRIKPRERFPGPWPP